MELTNKHKDTSTDTRTSFQEDFVTFINKHAGVFKALARGGTPHGDNWLAASRYATENGLTNVVPQKRIALLQRQVDDLSQTIASLGGNPENARRMTAQKDHKRFNATDEIGINRFRALKAEF